MSALMSVVAGAVIGNTNAQQHRTNTLLPTRAPAGVLKCSKLAW